MKQLNVKQLIEELKKYDENLTVVVTDGGKDHQYSIVKSDISVINTAYFGNDNNYSPDLDDLDEFLNLVII